MTFQTTETWARKYRPRSLDSVIGQKHAIAEIKGMIKRKSVPSTLLITGPTGTGKTTLSRIIAYTINELKYGVSTGDINEYNIGNTGGVDYVREIINLASYKPSSNFRVFVLDECFAKGTFVDTPNGKIPIENMRVGDTVYSSSGVNKVTNVFKNTIPLNRLIKLNFNNGTYLFCSKDHKFFTKRGEVEAQNLTLEDEYEILSVYNMRSQIRKKTAQSKKMLEVYKERYQKEGTKTKAIRLESIAFYERRGDQKHFESLLSDTEKYQGYTTLYDIEVENDHNYYVDGFLVHNCHKLSGAAASALLKPLEEPPPSTVWILATNEPEKLLPTILGRAEVIALKELTPKELVPRLRKICDKEEVKFLNDKHLLKIAENANAQPRAAISLLQSIVNTHAGSGDLDFKAILKQKLSSSPEVTAARLLIGVYQGKASAITSVIKSIQSREYIYIAQLLLDQNLFIMDKKLGNETWSNLVRDRIIEKLEISKLKLNTIISVHEQLVILKKELGMFLVPEHHYMIATLSKLAQKCLI